MITILEEAKLKYPIGTKFKCANGNIHDDVVGVNNSVDGVYTVYEYSCHAIKGGINSGNGWIYLNGVWAEIVESVITKTNYSYLIELLKRLNIR